MLSGHTPLVSFVQLAIRGFLIGVVFFAGHPASAQHSVHGEQREYFESLGGVSVRDGEVSAEAQGMQIADEGGGGGLRSSVEHAIDPDFVVFGYHPSYRNGREFHYRWQSLTHIGFAFVDFEIDGSLSSSAWVNRPAAFKAGGAAEANGVKVVMVVANDNFDETILATVMQSASLRDTLRTNIVNLVAADDYCHGVNLDFEFNWDATTRDGITAFVAALNADLKAMAPPRELSIYVNPTYSATRHDVLGLSPHIDHMLLSCYPWAGGFSSTVGAIAPANSFITAGNNYLNAGLPAEKLVLTLAAYGHRWTTNAPHGWGASIVSSVGSQSYSRALFETTLLTPVPYVANYQTGAESAWHFDGVDRTTVWDSAESQEFKMRLARSWQHSTGTHAGKRLGGVGFWELAWMTLPTSYDPLTNSTVSKTRTHGQIYQLMQEIFQPAGERKVLFEKFEGPSATRDFRWRSPAESPDMTAGTFSISQAAASAGAGAPENTGDVLRLDFTTALTSGNRIFLRHEFLNDDIYTSVLDTNALRVYVERRSRLSAHVHVGGAGEPGRTLRMVVRDALGQLELSPAVGLDAPGWREVAFDLTSGAGVSGYSSLEPNLLAGDGVVDHVAGQRSIGLVGFLVEGGGAGSGTLYFDELAYEPVTSGGAAYVINEFHKNDISAEFVEIYGPSGLTPDGLTLVALDNLNNSTTFDFSLVSIADAGAGMGFFVLGDPAVANVNSSAGFAAGVRNLYNTQPAALQLRNSLTGEVYDSVVYRAHGGLGSLIRQQARGVTAEGGPWLGESSNGTTSSGAGYGQGRWPDGADSDRNHEDFSLMRVTPGAPNGANMALPQVLSFDVAPPDAFQTYQAFAVTTPPAGVGPSPSGGSVHRAVDTSGGGVITYIGDASLGGDGMGYSVRGEVFIPSASTLEHAIGIGFCGTHGVNFFTSSTSARLSTGMENGYWIIYENAAGVGLANGRADHPGVFEFVMASHDQQDGSPVELLGSATLAATGAAGGAWTTFELSVDPMIDELIARINGHAIYRGPIPVGGRMSGAFMVGFRENHTGGPTANEGTWVDNLQLGDAVPVTLSQFGIE